MSTVVFVIENVQTTTKPMDETAKKFLDHGVCFANERNKIQQSWYF